MADGITFSCTRSGCPLQCVDHLGPSRLLYSDRKSALPPLQELAPTGSRIDSYYSHMSSFISHALCPLQSELVPSGRSFNRCSIAAIRPKMAIFDILVNIPAVIDERFGQQRREWLWSVAEPNVPIPEYDDLEIIEVATVEPSVWQRQQLRVATAPPIPDFEALDYFADNEIPVEVTDSGVVDSNPDSSPPRSNTKAAAPTGNGGEVQVLPSEHMVEVEQEKEAQETNATPLPPAVGAIRTKRIIRPVSAWKRGHKLAGDLETDSGVYSEPTSDKAESLMN